MSSSSSSSSSVSQSAPSHGRNFAVKITQDLVTVGPTFTRCAGHMQPTTRAAAAKQLGTAADVDQ